MIRAFFTTCLECGGDEPEHDGICPKCRDQYPLTVPPPAQARDIPSARPTAERDVEGISHE